jgi:hypothetical protein
VHGHHRIVEGPDIKHGVARASEGNLSREARHGQWAQQAAHAQHLRALKVLHDAQEPLRFLELVPHVVVVHDRLRVHVLEFLRCRRRVHTSKCAQRGSPEAPAQKQCSRASTQSLRRVCRHSAGADTAAPLLRRCGQRTASSRRHELANAQRL